jgi:F420-dependent methylenetetrahydromethanopterin dehydrogenase
MTNNKQSSVDLFIEQLEEKGKAYEENQIVRTINICIDVSDYMELKVQAKAMHKQEIVEAYYVDNEKNEGFDYYNKTYGGAEQ